MTDTNHAHPGWRYPQGSPLGNAARRIPETAAASLSAGGRLAAAAVAVAVVVSQDYDRTRMAAGALAALITLTVAPVWSRAARSLEWMGAGLAFFGGAALAAAGPAWLMLPAGGLAAAAIAVREAHRRRVPDVLAFFAAGAVVGGLVAVMVLTLEG